MWVCLDANVAVGGDEEDQTFDLRIANATFFHLIYAPMLATFIVYSLADGKPLLR